MASSSRIAATALRIARSPVAHVSRAAGRTAIIHRSSLSARQPIALLADFLPHRRYATTTSGPDTSTDPTLTRSLDLIDEGTQAFEAGDMGNAKKFYKESIGVKETSGGYFNLGVCEYHGGNHAGAIEAWESSIKLSPSADAYTNLASAYVLSKPPQPALAIKHLTSALELSPNDPEIAFNLAAILESTDNLETALAMYERAEKGGIDRAAQNIRSVSAKILAKGGEAGPAAKLDA